MMEEPVLTEQTAANEVATPVEVVTSTEHIPSDQTAPVAKVAEVAPTKSVALSENGDKWYQTIEALEITGLASELAKNCVLDHETDEQIQLHLDVSSEMLMTNAAINEIEQALNSHTGEQRKLVVAIRELTVETPAQYNHRRITEIQVEAEQHIENDSFVKLMSERFSARVVPGSVKPKA